MKIANPPDIITLILLWAILLAVFVAVYSSSSGDPVALDQVEVRHWGEPVPEMFEPIELDHKTCTAIQFRYSRVTLRQMVEELEVTEADYDSMINVVTGLSERSDSLGFARLHWCVVRRCHKCIEVSVRLGGQETLYTFEEFRKIAFKNK